MSDMSELSEAIGKRVVYALRSRGIWATIDPRPDDELTVRVPRPSGAPYFYAKRYDRRDAAQGIPLLAEAFTRWVIEHETRCALAEVER